MVAVLALMETPAIISGLLIARRGRDRGQAPAAGAAGGTALWREVLLNGSVVLLVGSFIVGMIVGAEGFAPIAPVFRTAFTGVLCLFLLDMGLIAARRLVETRSLTFRLVLIALLFPVVNGTIGAIVGTVIGLSTGSAAALAILTASASYIAVPAAMRMALPRADAGLYLAMSLGVTFPFNIMLGIPLFSWIARTIGG